MCGWLPYSCFTADAVLSSGVKQTLRLDAICEPAPGFAPCNFLNRDLKRKRLAGRLTKANR